MQLGWKKFVPIPTLMKFHFNGEHTQPSTISGYEDPHFCKALHLQQLGVYHLAWCSARMIVINLCIENTVA